MINQTMYQRGAESSVIREIFTYACERKEQIGAQNVFDFSLGNPSVPAPAAVRDSIERSLAQLTSEQLHGYTPAPGLPATRAAVAASLNRRFGTTYAAKDVFMTVGAAASVSCSLHALVNPGEEVIVIAPFFPEYRVWIENAGAVCREVLADQETFQIDVAAVRDAITPNTAAVIIDSPNNPTGCVLAPASLDAVVNVARAHGIYVVCDDVYNRLVYEPGYERLAARVDKDLREQVVVVESFSKPWAMTGWRMGWVAAAHPVIDQIAKAHQFTVSSAVSFCMPAAVRALELDPSHQLDTYRARRDRVLAQLAYMGLPVVEPAGAFYAFPRVEQTGLSSNEFCERAIREAGVALVPGTCFNAPGYVRLSYCIADDDLDEGLRRLGSFVAGL